MGNCSNRSRLNHFFLHKFFFLRSNTNFSNYRNAYDTTLTYMEEKKSLQERIRDIQRNSSLNREEKMAAIQAVHLENNLESKNDIESKAEEPCDHYNKKCGRFHFSCCDTIDNCHRCHAEHRNCSRRPPEIDEIECLECYTRQTPGTNCINCGIQFCANHCAICKIWTEPEITHCIHCGFCRVGKDGTLRHCHDCDMCFASDGFELHQENGCTKKSARHEVCPICLQSIHWNQKKPVSTKCGHNVHDECLKKFLQSGNYKCTICRKSLCDMSRTWSEIRYSIMAQPMPSLTIEINDVVESPYGSFRVQGIIHGDSNADRARHTHASNNFPMTTPTGGETSTATSGRQQSTSNNIIPSRESSMMGPFGGHSRSSSNAGMIANALQFMFPADSPRDDSSMYTGVFESWKLDCDQHVRATLRRGDVKKVMRCDVHCNDCGTESFGAPFHFLGTECKTCGGFNTQKI